MTIQYGDYTYPNSTITDYPESLGTKDRTAERPGDDGVFTMSPIYNTGDYIEPGAIAARDLTISGHLSPRGSDLLTLWKAFKAAHMPGVLRPLYVGYDSQYVLAEVRGFGDVNAAKYVNSIPWQVQFRAPKPLWKSSTQKTVSLTTGTTTITTYAGDMPASPVLTLPITTLGTSAVITITLSNGTWTRTLTIKTPGALTTLTVDMAAEKITTSAGVDATGLMSGVWWRLQPLASQTVNIGVSGGMVLTSPSIVWRDGFI